MTPAEGGRAPDGSDSAAPFVGARYGAGVRILVAGALGLLVFATMMALAPWQVAFLAGWDTTSAVVVAWVVLLTAGKDAGETAMLAMREDDSRAAADLVRVSSSVVSLAGVALGLGKASQMSRSGGMAVTILAVVTVVLSWAAVHVVFMLRYADIYYAEGGGIDFNEGSEPDYRDFAYLALTIGMTYQVSDTGLTSRTMRRAVTRHALLSYLFGTVVVAVTINVVAGLLR